MEHKEDIISKDKHTICEDGDSKLAEVVPIFPGAKWAANKGYVGAIGAASAAVDTAHTEIFTSLVNIAFTGSMREQNDSFDEGTTLCLSASDFEDCTDDNVIALLAIYEGLGAVSELLEMTLAKTASLKPKVSASAILGDEHTRFSELLELARTGKDDPSH